MAYNDPATAVTADLIPAAFWNTNGRDNIVWAHDNLVTAQGDISSLQTSRTTDEANITSLLASRTTDESAATEMETDITDLESAVAALQATSAWTAFTATLRQNGSAVAQTVNRASYQKLGRVCFMQIDITCNGAGTPSTGIDVIFSGAPAAASIGNAIPRGPWTLFTGSSAIPYHGIMAHWAVGQLAPFCITNEPNTFSFIGTNPVYTLKNGDIFTCSLMYETA